MEKDAEKKLTKKRFILDLIDDVELTLCKYNIGDPSKRNSLVKDIEPLVVKHIENLRAELKDIDNKVWSRDGNGFCNWSC